MEDDKAHQAFWTSIEEMIHKGKSTVEVQKQLKQAGVCSFIEFHSASAFFANGCSSTATKAPASASKAPSEMLEQLRTRVKLCVKVWAFADDSSDFSKAYAKAVRKSIQKKKHKKRFKEMTHVRIVLNDLIRMIQQAAFLLRPQATFAHFLQDCIPRDCYSAQFQYIWEYFEVENPYEAPPSPTPLPELKRRVSKPKRKLQEKPKQTTPSATTPSATTPPFLFNQVPLTTRIRKSNSLTSRSRFVGSHFNAGLTNVDVLFRQVTVVKKPMSKKKKLQTPPMSHPPSSHPPSKHIVASAFRSLKRRRI